MRRPRRTPVFGRRPTTLSTTPGTAHPLDRPRTKSNSREGPLRSWTGVTSKMPVTYVSPYGVWRHTCSSTPMTRTPSHRAGSLISRRAPSARTAVLAALPGHAQGLGDARHRHMMNNHARQRPAHHHARELGARIDRPLDSCLGATRENTPDTGSGQRSHARSWDATRRAHAPSA